MIIWFHIKGKNNTCIYIYLQNSLKKDEMKNKTKIQNKRVPYFEIFKKTSFISGPQLKSALMVKELKGLISKIWWKNL